MVVTAGTGIWWVVFYTADYSRLRHQWVKKPHKNMVILYDHKFKEVTHTQYMHKGKFFMNINYYVHVVYHKSSMKHLLAELSAPF